MITRDDVWALECGLNTKAIIIWLLDKEPRVFGREEIGRAVGLHPSKVEDAILEGMRQRPPVLRHTGPNGERLRPRFAYIAPDDPIRLAWLGLEAKPAPEVVETMPAPTDVEAPVPEKPKKAPKPKKTPAPTDVEAPEETEQ